MGLTIAQKNNLLEYIAARNSVTVFGLSLNTVSNWYVALLTVEPNDDGSGSTEPDIGTGDYARIVVASADWNSAAVGGELANVADKEFGASSAAWSTGATALSYFAFFSAATGGTPWVWGPVETPQAVNAANINLRFAAGQLKLAG